MSGGALTGPALAAELDRLAAAPRLLVALDFDGTLAPLVDDPAAARALPAAREALLGLHALPGTSVALVSGRALASLAEVGEAPDDLPLIGSHGLEVRMSATDALPPLDAADAGRVLALRSQLEPLVAQVEGAWIEAKPAGLAVHSRLVTDAEAARLLDAAVRASAAELDPALTVRAGKGVVEFAVRDATKGDGLRILIDRLAPDAVLFAGDDVTDEDGFTVLGPHDLGVKVGAGPTAARARVADPAAMAALLTHVLDARRRLSGDTR